MRQLVGPQSLWGVDMLTLNAEGRCVVLPQLNVLVWTLHGSPYLLGRVDGGVGGLRCEADGMRGRMGGKTEVVM